jgi:ribosome assembly protein YihI (activator of Der GTPase)
MEVLNQKLERAVESVKIKPKAKLKELQNNEKLVAINERVEEAINYRKELKDFEVEEANRVELLKDKHNEN